MATATTPRKSLRYFGMALLVMALFLVFAVFAIAMRPLMIVVALIATVVSLILYRFSFRFREWFEAVSDERIR